MAIYPYMLEEEGEGRRRCWENGCHAKERRSQGKWVRLKRDQVQYGTCTKGSMCTIRIVHRHLDTDLKRKAGYESMRFYVWCNCDHGNVMQLYRAAVCSRISDNLGKERMAREGRRWED